MSIKRQTFGGPELFGYYAEPEHGTSSGVLILPTIFGVNDFARAYADTLAGDGIAAAVWDIGSGLPLTTDYDECIRRARLLTDQRVAAMVARWTDTMLSKFGLSSVAILGFCIGGRFALLQAAADKRLRGCAMAYPSIESPRLSNQETDALTLAAEIECPALMIRPGNDHVTAPDTYETLTQTLLKRSAPTSLQFHPDAEHGFMHRRSPQANVAATRLASPQVIGFLAACLS